MARSCCQCALAVDERFLAMVPSCFPQDLWTRSQGICGSCLSKVSKHFGTKVGESLEVAKQIVAAKGEALKSAEDRVEARVDAFREQLLRTDERAKKARMEYDAARKCVLDYKDGLFSSVGGGDPSSPEDGPGRLFSNVKKEVEESSPAGRNPERFGNRVPLHASPRTASFREGASGVTVSKARESTIVLTSSSEPGTESDTQSVGSNSDGDSDYDVDSDLCAVESDSLPHPAGRGGRGTAVGAAKSIPPSISVAPLARARKKTSKYPSEEKDTHKAQQPHGPKKCEKKCRRRGGSRWTAAEEDLLRQEVPRYNSNLQGTEFYQKLAESGKFGGRSWAAIQQKRYRLNQKPVGRHSMPVPTPNNTLNAADSAHPSAGSFVAIASQ